MATLPGGIVSVAANEPALPPGGAAGINFADHEVNAAMGLEVSTRVTLDVPQAAGQPIILPVPIEGALFTLNLAPYSVRVDTYEVRIQLADGSYQTIEPEPVRTLRGTVAEVEGSVAVASLLDDGLHARIEFPGANVYWVEPLISRVAGAGTTDYVVYHAEDVIPSEGKCTALDVPLGGAAQTGTESAGNVATSGVFFTELGIDVDFEYYQLFSDRADPIAAVEDDVNFVINTINAQQFEPQVSIRHLITTIIIRTAEPDPYPRTCSGGSDHGAECTSSFDCPGGTCPLVDSETLLFQFRNHWNSQHNNIQRDVAQLFTGKNLAGSTIGVAWVGSVCQSSGYSLVQSKCCGSDACQTDLSAHELGHNWGATHCGGLDCSPSCPGFTMNCSLTCANVFRENGAVQEILQHRDSRTCIDKGDELRRIIVSTPSNTMPESSDMQFTATADFVFGSDQDITNDVVWTSQPPEAGFINSAGLFSAADVDGDVCVDVTATYDLRGEIFERTKTILIEDLDTTLALVNSNPPSGAIDARQPSQPDGSFPTGLQTVDVTLTGDVCFVTRSDFTASQIGGVLGDPLITSIEPIGPRSVRVHLFRDMEPGAWTVVTHPASGTSVQVGYLPGDVTEDGFVDGADLVALVDALGGIGDPLPLRSVDMDRSGRLAVADLIRALDLFNGSDVYQAWYLRSLP